MGHNQICLCEKQYVNDRFKFSRKRLALLTLAAKSYATYIALYLTDSTTSPNAIRIYQMSRSVARVMDFLAPFINLYSEMKIEVSIIDKKPVHSFKYIFFSLGNCIGVFLRLSINHRQGWIVYW